MASGWWRPTPAPARGGGRGASPQTPPAAVWVPAVLVGLAMALPLAYLVARGAGGGLDAWGLLAGPRTALILGRTTLLVAAVTAGSVALAVPLAWLTARTDLPGRRAWAVAGALPLVVPSYVGAFLAVSALGPRGLLQQVLAGPLGVDRLPDIYGFPGAAITLTLLSYPYVMLTVRSALARIDPALEESARSLGYGPWAVAARVTVPLLRPSIAAGAVLVALYALSDFGAVSLMRYETFTWAIYEQYQSAFDRSAAASLALVLVALAAGILWVEARWRGRMRYYQAGPGATRRQALVRLGRWRWVAAAYCAAVALAALGLPVSVLAYWLVRGVTAGEVVGPLWGAVSGSLSASGLAAVVAAVCSVPVAFLAVRYPGRLSRALERASFVGYALPGVVVALALVFFGIHFARPLYQTLWLLVFAYVVLFLPAALGSTRAALLQVNPRLEEAARSLGRTPLQALVAVTVPLIRAGVLSGGALVFLVAMKELPATLVLGPLGFKTLATSVWSASSEAFFARAAAPALVLVVASSVPLAFLMLRGKGAGP